MSGGNCAYALVEDIQPDYRLLYKRVENCETEGCHADVWTPHGAAVQGGEERKGGCPLAIYIHGGGFAKGSTMNIAFNQVKWWLEHGVAVVSLEYRLVPHVTHADIREDLMDAYAFIQHELNSAIAAKSSSAPTIDLSNCILAGASAGGTCVLFLAADIVAHNEGRRQPSSAADTGTTFPVPRAVLAAYPVTNASAMWTAPRAALEAFVREHRPHLWDETSKIYGQKVSCADPDQDNVMDPNVPMEPRKLWFRAALDSHSLNSFLYAHDPPYPPSLAFPPHATPAFPPTWIYRCSADTLVPPAQSDIAIEALRGVGVEVVRDDVDAPHGSLDLPGRYFPEQATGWWEGHVEPSLIWAQGKMRAGLGQ